MFCLNGGAVSWKSSQQSTVADSTTEAEYIAAFDAVMVLLHKQKNLDHISDPNTFLGIIISFKKSLREVTLRYAEFQQMIMLLIH